VSDLARVYAPGQEPAKGGQDLSRPYPNGKELGHNGNGDKAHGGTDLDK
jgi:hypothetical protein